MKRLILIINILLFLTIIGLNGQDTVASKLDTVICVPMSTEYIYVAPYDDGLYSFEWIDNEGVVVSTEEQYSFEKSDSLFLVSSPLNPGEIVFVDTIIVNISFLPELNFFVPDVDCYDGSMVAVLDNSVIDSQFTQVLYTLSNGANPLQQNDTIFIDVPNGGELVLTANFEHGSCSFDTSFVDTIRTKFMPQLSFTEKKVCFGDSTIVYNSSIYDRNIGIAIYSNSFIGTFEDNSDSVSIFLPTNSEPYNWNILINQEGCIAEQSIDLSTLLQPTAIFSTANTCENEKISVVNNSEDVLNASYLMKLSGTPLSLEASSLILSDTLARGEYQLEGIVANQNGCSDTLLFTATVDSVTYVDYSNLLNEYCERQDISTLQANVNGGAFQGKYVADNGDGTAIFDPTSDDNDVSISFTYTNSLGCTDTYVYIVDTIYPKPDLLMSGLNSTYCELDDSSIISINQSLSSNSEYTVERDGNISDSFVGIEYTFDPIVPGSYTVRNVYESVDGCINSVEQTTVVNPLPALEVDSLVTIDFGMEIEVGNLGPDQPNVNYLWSNGDESSSIFVSQPGLYIVEASNDLTGCNVKDSLELQYDASIISKLDAVSIFPNPTANTLNIELSIFTEGIQLVSSMGESILIGGQSLFATDQSGMLSLNVSFLASGYYYIIIPGHGVFLLIKQ